MCGTLTTDHLRSLGLYPAQGMNRVGSVKLAHRLPQSLQEISFHK